MQLEVPVDLVFQERIDWDRANTLALGIHEGHQPAAYPVRRQCLRLTPASTCRETDRGDMRRPAALMNDVKQGGYPLITTSTAPPFALTTSVAQSTTANAVRLRNSIITRSVALGALAMIMIEKQIVT